MLGFDTARSMDHDWGPRLQVLLPVGEPDATAGLVRELLDRELTVSVDGHVTRFIDSPDEPGARVLTGEPTQVGVHGVTVSTVPAFLLTRLGVGSAAELDPAAWLTVPDQLLLEVTAGGVWRDDDGELTAARSRLSWYPDQVWRYRLAAGWRRIAQHEAFVGRTGEVGDDLGSQLVALALVRDVVLLAFLLERRYAPYEKWLGSAFDRLELAVQLRPTLDVGRYAGDWRTREAALVAAVVILGQAQNALGICPAVDPTPRRYFGRPFTVVAADRFADAVTATITDPVVRGLPSRLGGIDQYVDTTDGLVCRPLHLAICAWLRRGEREPSQSRP